MSTNYSYRVWEYGRIESCDPFDASGSFVLYSMYNNNIFKIGPLISTFNSWCTDKIRHFIDCFKCVRYLMPYFIKYFNKYSIYLDYMWSKYILYSSTWIGLLYCIIKYQVLFSIVFFVSGVIYQNYLSYDVFTNNFDLLSYLNYIKIHNIINIFIYEVIMFDKLWLCIGVLKYMKILEMNNYIYIIYSSLINYNYPNIYVYDKVLCMYVVGVFGKLNLYNKFKHLFIGISGILYVLLSMSILNVYTVYICNYFSLCNLLFTKYSLVSMCLYLYLYPKALLSALIIYNYFSTLIGSFYTFSKYVEVLIYECYNIFSTLLSSYSFFILEALFFNVFIFDQLLNAPYVYYIVDSYMGSLFLKSSKISILFTAFAVLNTLMVDIVIPIKLYVESKNLLVTYYGRSRNCNNIIMHASIFNIYDIIYVILNIVSAVRYRVCLNIYINIYNTEYYYSIYLYKHYFGYVYKLYQSLRILKLPMELIYIIAIILWYKYFINIHICNQEAIVRYNIYRNIVTYIILSTFLDFSTFFLTGSCCSVSKYMAKFRHRSVKYTIL